MGLGVDPNVIALDSQAFADSSLYTADEKAQINQTVAAYENSSSVRSYFI